MDYVGAKFAALFGSAGALTLMSLLLGTFLLWRRKQWQRGRMLLTLLVLLLYGLIFSPLQPFLTGTLEDRFPANPTLPDRIDGIIVLGGMIRPNVSRARHRPSLNDAAERLLDAARLAALHPEAKLLFTGGSADPWDKEASEAVFAAKLLRQLGVADDRLIIEDQARNSYENAVFSRKLVPARADEVWLLVTSAAHLPRAVGVFRKAGWRVIPWPTNYLTGGGEDWINEDFPISRLYRLSRTLHEFVGLLYYRLRGWSDAFLPAPLA